MLSLGYDDNLNKPATPMPIFPAYAQMFLWPGKMLYLGCCNSTEARLHGGAALLVGVYRPMRISLADGVWQSCRCAVIPAGVRYKLDLAGGILGKLFIERDSAYSSCFQQRFPTLFPGNAFMFQDLEVLETMQWIYETHAGKETVEQRINQLLGYEENQTGLALDQRVMAALELMRQEPEYNYPQEYIAAAVDLSPSRFLHLFREQTGVPYRRFRLWKRLVSAMEIIRSKDSFTYAAHDAGFSDAAHFSRSFRDTFGINPAPVFRGLRRFDGG